MSISLKLWHAQTSNSACLLFIPILKELCLRFLIQALVSILFKKLERFCKICKHHFLNYIKQKLEPK